MDCILYWIYGRQINYITLHYNNNVGSVVVAAVSGFVHDYNYDYDDYDCDEQQKCSKAWMKAITQQGDSYVVKEVPVAACVKTATY